MQSKALSLLSAVSVLVTLGVPLSEADTAPTCENNLPSNINCSPAKSIEDIQQFLQELSASNVVKDINTFVISENDHIQYLPAGLLEGFRFSEVIINFCSQLSRADDFLGTSGASVRSISMMNNALTEMPAFTAPNIEKLLIYQSTRMAVYREAFKGMANIENIRFADIRLEPNAFIDLKNLKSVEVIYMAPDEAVISGAFHFASPVFELLTLQTNRRWKGQAQPGAYDGFVKDSVLWITESTEIPRDVYFNVLNSGAILKIYKPVTCDCRVAWLRLSPLVSNANITCQTGSSVVDLASMPEEDYVDCPGN